MNRIRTYSLADIARKLGRPRTTLQAWRDSYKPYIPTVSGTKGRATRYDENSIRILELIMRMKDDNEPPEMIEKALRDNSTYLAVDADDKDDDKTTPFVPALYDSMREIATALEQQREFNVQLLGRLETQERFNAQLIEHLSTQEDFNKRLLEQLEKQQEYIDDKMTKRDEELIRLVREQQETK
ncbi:MerR family transcriptional regulator [Ectobacillus funiculus]|uniref:MerR family transcriptional regulator n=1 Tax=Ectobacillus funiculus TaxID=137993 RepID=UPI00101C7E92